ncbi:hypothetical protein FH972_005084 [Carpinus fangiana]|uniref:Uncharacterized protein n=1 Tax=Carpinus fangiana TaxID=176857 RepID=A0A5N6QN53_9ROSI|nr:hypothetical protein FH972_005084 [Carpinus fangiana]
MEKMGRKIPHRISRFFDCGISQRSGLGQNGGSKSYVQKGERESFSDKFKANR